jgi:IclR family transcriptional regulator, KDG regulon repressor
MKAKSTEKSPAAYNTVHHVADILRDLSRGMNTVTEIAESNKLSKSTVSRLLNMLVSSDLATCDPIHRRFYIGPLVSQLGANPKTNHFRLTNLGADEMNHLSEISHELISLSILVGTRIVHLHIIPSRRDIQVVEGKQVFQGATIKVLFSQLVDKDLELAIDTIKLENVTENSVTDKEELIKQVKEIQTRGYAVTSGERVPGAIAISAPIKKYVFPASLSIIGVESSLKPKIPGLLKELVAATCRISNRLVKKD